MNYSPLRHIGSIVWKHEPIQLTFFLTKKCNARCPFCFYLSRRDALLTPELTLDEIRRVSLSLGRLLWLAFSGGEIFLREDLVEIAKTFYGNNRPAIILLPTNGLLPDRIREQTEAILKKCPKSTVAVKISLDGPEDVHDALRRVPGAYRKALETVDTLRPLLERYPNFELGINTVFCSANEHCMDGIIDLVQGIEGVGTHTVSLVRGEVAEEGLKKVDLAAYERTIKKLEANLKKERSGYRFRGSKLKTAQDLLQRRLIHETARKNERLIPCYAGRLTLVLTETGECYPCESFAHRMGNVREWEYDVKKLLAGADAQTALRAVRGSGCNCTHECYMMMNILFNPALYPALAKEYVSL
ncbi:MAG: radical SAM/SPASM domain-containing protein [Nitrospirota bacterium]